MWNQRDFCDKDSGFDYVFTKMNAIYGSAFENNWRNVDPDIVRQTWIEACGIGLTYKPKMDYALQHMNADRPPSALAFAKLLLDGPRIPQKEHSIIEHQRTKEDEERNEKLRKEAVLRLRELASELGARMTMK